MNLEIVDTCDLCDSPKIEEIDADCCIFKCISCGFIFSNPRPHVDSLIEFYSKPMKYHKWILEESARSKTWLRRLIIMEEFKKKGTLLDIGTGIGQMLHLAKPYYSNVYGTEISRSAIEIARSRYGLTIFEGELEQTDFEGIVFDNVSLFHVLEHVPSPRDTVRKCWTLLEKGGILFVAVPNDFFSLKTKVKIALRNVGLRKYSHLGKLGLPQIKLDSSIEEIHLSHFTPIVLRKLLERTGFEVIHEILDPYYIRKGLMSVLHGFYYHFCSLLLAITNRNYYDTIWMIAEKI